MVAFAVAATSVAQAAPAPPIYVNGTLADTAAIERGGHVFVPMRSVFGHLGTSVMYTPPRSVTARKNNAELVHLTIDSRNATVNGTSRVLSDAPFRYRAMTFVPLRLISESAGAVVAYTTSPRTIHISDAVRPGAAVVAPLATSAPAPVPAEQKAGTPWWLWPLIGLLVLAALIALLLLGRRRKADPIIVTRTSARK